MEDRIHRSLTTEPLVSAAAGCLACMSRRDFLARSALAAAALAALEGCGDGQIGAPTTLTDGPFTVRIADFPGLNATGVLVNVSSQAPERAVIRTGASAYAAFSMICTHQQCLTDVRNNRFECPCHGSRFANDGSVINGPAEQPLQRLAVTVNGDGTLTVG
jgi:Rieske Fe-S protein